MMVSFDVDGTILRESVQRYAKELVDRGVDVHIVTRRYSRPEMYGKLFCEIYRIKNIDEEHNALFVIADKCGIKRDNIHFTNMDDKFKFFVENEGFLWHLDDDYWECMDINKWSKTMAISCSGSSNWRHKCERFIKKKLKK